MGLNLGKSPELVQNMFRKGKVRMWSYSPIIAGFTFSISTIALRSAPRLQLAAQIASGSFLFFGSQYIAADALIHEKNGNTSQNYGREM